MLLPSLGFRKLDLNLLLCAATCPNRSFVEDGLCGIVLVLVLVPGLFPYLTYVTFLTHLTPFSAPFVVLLSACLSN